MLAIHITVFGEPLYSIYHLLKLTPTTHTIVHYSLLQYIPKSCRLQIVFFNDKKFGQFLIIFWNTHSVVVQFLFLFYVWYPYHLRLCNRAYCLTDVDPCHVCTCMVIYYIKHNLCIRTLIKVTSLSSIATSAGGGLKEASISSKSNRVVRWGSCRSKSIGMLSFWGAGKQDAGSWTPSPFRSLLGAPKDTKTILKLQVKINLFF